TTPVAPAMKMRISVTPDERCMNARPTEGIERLHHWRRDARRPVTGAIWLPDVSSFSRTRSHTLGARPSRLHGECLVEGIRATHVYSNSIAAGCSASRTVC